MGGIVLIEMHSPGPTNPATDCSCNPGQCNYIAMEYWQAEFDAIQTATANGVIVVAAAGNGSTNLDAPVYGGAFDRSFRDSGAIIVGAGTAYTRTPMCWTNHGSRVDLQGWGESVTTLEYGDLFQFPNNAQTFYTSRFSGTSSASPIVVGAAASAQGVALARGRRLTSTQIRSLMRTTGTPQAADARQIGPLPNLRRILPRVISGAY
ncbi:S8 family serine peptidase [Myxococcus sp. 1LA]